MLNGLYGYIFGSASADSSTVGQVVQPNNSGVANKQPANDSKNVSLAEEAGEWIMVGEDGSKGAEAAPPQHLLDECRSLSSSAPSMTASWSEEMEVSGTAAAATAQANNSKAIAQQKRMANQAIQQQRQWLTKMLFADPTSNKQPTSSTDTNNYDPTPLNGNPSSARLKRASKVELVQSQAKTKPRSKKCAGGKYNANRNNDRKCNPHNLD